MVTAIVVLICILTMLLILVVLIQNSKGGGLAGEFGGLGSNQLMGVKKTTDLLEQITWGLGAAVMVLTLASYVLIDKGQASTTINSANIDRAQTRSTPAPAPVQPAPSTSPANSQTVLTPQK